MAPRGPHDGPNTAPRRPKMAPRQRQDEAKMASRCCFKSSIVSGGVQGPSGLKFPWILNPPGKYF